MTHDRIGYLQALHDHYNEEEFGGKLMPIGILIKRNQRKDGWYEYVTEKRDGPRSEAWWPRRDRLDKAVIILNEGCWDEGTVDGTLLHEMIHQYQAEVLDRKASHDAILCSIARRLERKYGFKVR